jgi:indole-3-glycerol phosphate synthase
MDILHTIMAERREDVARLRRERPLEALLAEGKGRARHSLRRRLAAGGGTRIIAELKKASPSAGLIRSEYRPGEVARAYEAAGAAAVSVLTEPRHFLGGAAHLREVRRAVAVPVLRKDFICDAYQVAEAAAWGADVVLLIVAGLEEPLLRELYAAAVENGLEVLAEAHTEREAETALALEGAVLGINSRDLRTLKTDLAVARRLAAGIPAGRAAIAESGIRTRRDVEALEALGYRGFLVGEVLMASDSPARKLAELLGR